MKNTFSAHSFRFASCATAAALLLASASGCGKGKTVPGLAGFRVGVIQGRLYASFTSLSLSWDEGITVPVPGLKDAQISVAPDLNSAGTVFQISVGLQSLLNHGNALPLSGLPDGRSIPDIQSGQLPRWDTRIKNLNLSLYLSQDAFALFVPLNFVSKSGVTLPWMVSVPIQDDRGNVLGRAYAIPSSSSGQGSGLFVLLPYLGGEPHSGQGLEESSHVQ